MMKIILGLVALTLLSSAAMADDMVTATPNALKWGDAPPGLPTGAKMSVIAGDPTQTGPFVLRMKMPEGYAIPAHHHPTTENVTVISGVMHIGSGDKLDKKSGQMLKAGGFVLLPANMNHFAWSSSPSIIQIHGDGPFAITYVNPADDPRNKK